MNRYLCITPRDPVIARDGRPFGVDQGDRVRGLDWPFPSLVAGSFRTALGKQWFGGFEDTTSLQLLSSVSVAGPFPLVCRRLFLPAPRDCFLNRENKIYTMRPEGLREGEGTDLPADLEPVVIAEGIEDSKPGKSVPWWSAELLARWLTEPNPREFKFDDPDKSKDVLKGPSKDSRTHVEICNESYAAEDSRLFMTEGLELDGKNTWSLAARFSLPSGSPGSFKDDVQPLGGERRLVYWRNDDDQAKLWECPAEVRQSLKSNNLVRMMLATPGIFSCGWRPGWLKNAGDGWQGMVPGTNVKVRLVGAVTGRWQAVSGYSYRKLRDRPARQAPETNQRLDGSGPKPIRRTVPAGSVYFFEILNGQNAGPAQLADVWLQSVCDLDKDRRQGFGLAVWGIWERHPSTKGDAPQ